MLVSIIYFKFTWLSTIINLFFLARNSFSHICIVVGYLCYAQCGGTQWLPPRFLSLLLRSSWLWFWPLSHPVPKMRRLIWLEVKHKSEPIAHGIRSHRCWVRIMLVCLITLIWIRTLGGWNLLPGGWKNSGGGWRFGPGGVKQISRGWSTPATPDQSSVKDLRWPRRCQTQSRCSQAHLVGKPRPS